MKIQILLLSIPFGYLLGYLHYYFMNKLVRQFKSDDQNISFSILHSGLFSLAFAGAFTIPISVAHSIYILTIFFICYLIAMLDIKIMIIPNKVILSLLIIQGIFIASGLQTISIKSSLMGFLIGFLSLAVPYYLGAGIGGGDVKLLAVLGFLTGFMGVLYVMIGVGALAAIYILAMSKLKGTSFLDHIKDVVPMGPLITLSFMVFTVYRFLS